MLIADLPHSRRTPARIPGAILHEIASKMPFPRWNRLPPELQLNTLQLLACAEYSSRASLVNYTITSKSWQAVFEAVTFCELYLLISDMRQFSKVCSGYRRKYVRYIGVIIDLPEELPIYTRVLHGTEEEIAMAQMFLMTGRLTSHTLLPGLGIQTKRNDAIFTSTLYSFLAVLTGWKVAECHQSGISLEIIVTSESYWQMVARRIQQTNAATTTYANQLHTRRIRAIELPPILWHRILGAAELNFHMELSLDPAQSTLPTVQVVSKFSILRRTIRNFSIPALTSVMNCFPMLGTVEFEFRERFYWWHQHLEDRQYIAQLPQWSDSLRCVRIHQVKNTIPIPNLAERVHICKA